MSKIYLVAESDVNGELPAGLSFIDSGIFSISENKSIPTGFREATTEEMATPVSLLESIGEDITLAGDAYQTAFLGSTSPKREARFAINLDVAKRLIENNYGDNAALKQADTQSMTMQSESQNEGRTPLEFAQWIVEWESKSVLVAGAIEAFIKKSKLNLPNIPNLIDQTVKAQHYAELKQQATALFAEITGQ